MHLFLPSLSCPWLTQNFASFPKFEKAFKLPSGSNHVWFWRSVHTRRKSTACKLWRSVYVWCRALRNRARVASRPLRPCKLHFNYFCTYVITDIRVPCLTPTQCLLCQHNNILCKSNWIVIKKLVLRTNSDRIQPGDHNNASKCKCIWPFPSDGNKHVWSSAS